MHHSYHGPSCLPSDSLLLKTLPVAGTLPHHLLSRLRCPLFHHLRNNSNPPANPPLGRGHRTARHARARTLSRCLREPWRYANRTPPVWDSDRIHVVASSVLDSTGNPIPDRHPPLGFHARLPGQERWLRAELPRHACRHGADAYRVPRPCPSLPRGLSHLQHLHLLLDDAYIPPRLPALRLQFARHRALCAYRAGCNDPRPALQQGNHVTLRTALLHSPGRGHVPSRRGDWDLHRHLHRRGPYHSGFCHRYRPANIADREPGRHLRARAQCAQSFEYRVYGFRLLRATDGDGSGEPAFRAGGLGAEWERERGVYRGGHFGVLG